MDRSSSQDRPTVPESHPRWETWAVRVILVGFLASAFDAIHNGTTSGQDSGAHMDFAHRVVTDPKTWFFLDFTSRPMIYWLGGALIQFTHDQYAFQLASMLFVFAAVAALWLLHDASRRLIASPTLRVNALAFVAFLPVTIVTAVVYAGDTAAYLPFVLTGWSLVRCLEAESERKSWGYAGLAGAALALGNFCKATFLPLPSAVLFVVLALWRGKNPSARRGGRILLLAVLLPFLVGGWLDLKAEQQLAGVEQRHDFNWQGTGEMTLRNAVGLKFSDARIFAAPTYWRLARRDGKVILPLLVPNDFTYPALLHLGTFTDVLDYSRSDGRSGPRPEPQKTSARVAVRFGVLFSLGAVLTVGAFWLRVATACFRPRIMPGAPALVWSALGAVWYLPIVFVLPFIYNVYGWGYWLPRLVVPALWVFFLTFFATVDRLPGRWRRAVISFFACTVPLLAAFEIRSIWY
jgi:hypothetical protein